MQIVINPAPGHRFDAVLYMNGEAVEFVNDKKPGCCVRSLMNKLMLEYGKPDSQITIDIDGW
jgi:hypothetical protein